MTTLPYGMRQIKLTPYATGTTLGTSVPLPNARTLSFSEAEEFQELRGDDKVVTTRGRGANVEWELEAGGLDFEAYRTIAGGTITTSGVAPNVVKQYRKLDTESRPFFKAEGRAISDSGGDVHVILYKCRVTGEIEGEFSDGEFFLTSASGVALGSPLTGSLGALYDFIHNETETAIA